MKNLSTMLIVTIFFVVCMAFPSILLAQKGTISGTVTDGRKPLPNATILIPDLSVGTFTDENGTYSLSVDAGTYSVEARYVGFSTLKANITVSAGGKAVSDFILIESFVVEEVVLLGSRSSNRTNVDAPVPIDVINVAKITAIAPQSSLNQIMHYAAPSFTSNTQTISDGTDHIDPASLRGLGPDQVLVLMNGKRRHNSSLINVNGTFGRGQVGTDLNAVPAMAVQNIEVLRDGAAAQYGSDAIAGVINLKLREDVNKLTFTLNSGANFTKNSSPQKDIDGEVAEIGINYGLPIGEKGGFINLTGMFNYRGWTNRMQSFSGSIFNGYNAVEWVANDKGADLSNLSEADVKNYAQDVNHFSSTLKSEIANAPDLATLRDLLSGDVTEAELQTRSQTRSDYNMRVGQSELRGGKFFANMAIPLGDDLEFYSFGGIGYRDGTSGCFYRLPNQNRTYTPTFINGMVPKINSNITDKSIAGGIRGVVQNWNVDFSNAFGTNQFLFHMEETNNATLGNGSTFEFDAGGHAFFQNTSNIDIARYFDVKGIEGINIAFGSEYRFENFQVIPGTVTSYGNYDKNGNLVTSITPDSLFVTDFLGRQRPSGSQCFAGFLPSNQVDAKRSSVAGYVDTEFDITESLLVNAAARYENYSDFGSTFNYKVAARYKAGDITFRAATSTGFRAPSLHQIHFSRTSTIFVTQNNVTTAQEVGVFANTSRAARLLGIPELKQETSQNFSAGVTAKFPEAGLRITIDGYLVNIDDRVVLTGQFGPGSDPELMQIFSQAQATRAAFFSNAIDTESKGLDVVISHSILLGTKGNVLRNDLAGTFTKTTQVGDIKASDLLREKGLVGTYFNEEGRIYLEEAVPRIKFTLSNSLDVGNLNIYLRNTYFGETTEATDITALDPSVDYINDGKVITDISLRYNFTDTWSLTVGSNNLLDIYPDEADPAFQSSGRFVFSRRSPQFSYGGRFLFARLGFSLQ